MIEKIKFFIKHDIIIVTVTAFLASIISFFYFYNNNLSHLTYSDSLSRLNISRRVVDSLTPGLAQLGNIWLPFPQFLMLPFIWNNYLWQTGLAGYIVSGIAFMSTAIYLYKIGRDIFNSKLSGAIMFIICISHINLLYMQTTAMSEILIICFLVLSTYYLMQWCKEFHLKDLVLSATFIALTTLTRYEGYLVFIISLLVVFIVCAIKYKKYKNTEGLFVLFGTLASAGIMIWLLYSWTIFGDPFYWKNIYGGSRSIISTDTEEIINTLKPKAQRQHSISGLINSTKTYTTSVLYMNGMLYFILALAAIIIIIFSFKKLHKENIYKLLPMLILMGPWAFVIYTNYSAGLPIDGPALTIRNILTKATSMQHEYNIRYGLEMFPLICILIGYIFSKKIPLVKSIFLILVVLQITLIYFTNINTMYQFNIRMINGPSLYVDDESAKWLKANYDGGLIMMSTLKHDPFMFLFGINYSNYIYEGTGKYWLTSRDTPQKYATWIYMHKKYAGDRDSDSVTKYLHNNNNVKKYYDLKYDDGKVVIYKIKDPSILDPSVQNLAHK